MYDHGNPTRKNTCHSTNSMATTTSCMMSITKAFSISSGELGFGPRHWAATLTGGEIFPDANRVFIWLSLIILKLYCAGTSSKIGVRGLVLQIWQTYTHTSPQEAMNTLLREPLARLKETRQARLDKEAAATKLQARWRLVLTVRKAARLVHHAPEPEPEPEPELGTETASERHATPPRPPHGCTTSSRPQIRQGMPPRVPVVKHKA
jgi:hypothetical protein